MLLFYVLKIYFSLKDKFTGRRTSRERKPSICWLMSKMVAMTRVKLIRSWEPGAFSRFPCRVPRTWTIHCCFLQPQTENWIGSEAAGTWTGIDMAYLLGGGLVCWARVPALRYFKFTPKITISQVPLFMSLLPNLPSPLCTSIVLRLTFTSSVKSTRGHQVQEKIIRGRSLFFKILRHPNAALPPLASRMCPLHLALITRVPSSLLHRLHSVNQSMSLLPSKALPWLLIELHLNLQFLTHSGLLRPWLPSSFTMNHPWLTLRGQ